MMHHRYQRRLSDYLEGILSPEDCARLESHLQECQECTSELRALQRTVELLHDLPSPAPPSPPSHRPSGRFSASASMTSAFN